VTQLTAGVPLEACDCGMETHAFSGPLIGALMVAVGTVVGAGPRRYTRAFWRPDKSIGFTLRLLVGLCMLYGAVWVLQSR
jgi:hypothetical protein